MPTAAGHPPNCRVQARSRVLRRLADVDPYPAHTLTVHLVECRIGRGVSDRDDASCPRAEPSHSVERAAIVGTVSARLNNDDSIDVERLEQHLQVVGCGRRVPVPACRRIRKASLIAEDVCVGIAGSSRHGESHRGGRLWSRGRRLCATSTNCSRRGGCHGNQDLTSRQHGTPMWYAVRGKSPAAFDRCRTFITDR